MSAFCPFFSFHEKPILRSKTIELPRNLTWEDKPVPQPYISTETFPGPLLRFRFGGGMGGLFPQIHVYPRCLTHTNQKGRLSPTGGSAPCQIASNLQDKGTYEAKIE